MPTTPASTAVVPNIKSGTSAPNAGGICDDSSSARQKMHKFDSARQKMQGTGLLRNTYRYHVTNSRRKRRKHTPNPGGHRT